MSSSSAREKRLRLDRLLVARGVGGRRDVQRLIRRGYVTMNGVEVRDPNAHVAKDISLLIDGVPCEAMPALIAYHKPLHQLCTMRDPWGRSGLDHVLPAEWRESLHPVGRLDAETTGLLLFSSDGQLTQHLLHPKRELPRRYRAVVSFLPHDLDHKLSNGVDTSSGTFTATLKHSETYDPSAHQAYLEGHSDLEEIGGVVWIEVTEGKHRMVRRMLHNAGASVLALHRECYGSIELKELKVGEYVIIDPELIDTLRQNS